MISDSILFSFFSTCSTIFNSRSNNLDIDFMYLFLFYRIVIYMSIRAAPRCIIYEPRCIKTQKGRRITPTPQLLSGFICPYHWHFFRCFNLHICTASLHSRIKALSHALFVLFKYQNLLRNLFCNR